MSNISRGTKLKIKKQKKKNLLRGNFCLIRTLFYSLKDEERRDNSHKEHKTAYLLREVQFEVNQDKGQLLQALSELH